jgi:hypothetical protein
MSENEKLDDHMRNGTDYVNLPAPNFPTDRAPTWTRKLEKRILLNPSSRHLDLKQKRCLTKSESIDSLCRLPLIHQIHFEIFPIRLLSHMFLSFLVLITC